MGNTSKQTIRTVLKKPQPLPMNKTQPAGMRQTMSTPGAGRNGPRAIKDPQPPRNMGIGKP